MEEDECKTSKVQPTAKLTIKDATRKPAEIYRTDLITAMKIPDHQLVLPGSYFDLTDAWKQEWERGVQVPVNIGSQLPQPSFRLAQSGLNLSSDFKMSNRLIKCQMKKEKESPKPVSYDLDDEDVEWLKCLNKSRRNKGLEAVDELLMEKAITCLEDQCYTNMGETISTAKGLSIEYDENICCDVCRVPECEDGNEIIFCDVCDVAVHQACYGVQKVPVGSWVCRPCAQLLSNCSCVLCSTKGGAMKRTKTKNIRGWVHMSCALWIPEVGIGDVLKMEPITRIETIAPGRWNLLCYLCKEKKGACIQCSVKTCVTAFHVTCGFDNNLEMQTVLDESAADGVRHVCYCYKHGPKKSGRSPRKSASSTLQSPRKPLHKSPSATPSKSMSSAKTKEQEEEENLRQKKLRGMEEEFYNFADIKDLAGELQVSVELAKTFHRFWTLKRKNKDDASLLPPTAEQQESLTGRQIKPYQRASMEIERVVRLRQDLERIRNLCYMVEKREKQKRELTRARESVFWKELEIVKDTSGKMSSDDIRWARSCCANNFTEYETLQSIDLTYRKKKTYKRHAKRRRRRVKHNVVSSTEEEVSCGSRSPRQSFCEDKNGLQRRDTSDSSEHSAVSNTVCSTDKESLVDRGTTRQRLASTVSSNEPMSNEDLDEDVSSETCCASSLRNSKRLEDMSSDSDFEDESFRKARRRAAIRRRIAPLKPPKKDEQKNGIIRCNDSASSSPGTSNHQVNGFHVEDEHLGLVPVTDLKTSGEFENMVLRSPNRVIDRNFNRNRKRLLDEFQRKIDDTGSQKISKRILRSNRAVLEGQMFLDKCDIGLSSKRFCRRNGVALSPRNDENAVHNRDLREHDERLEDAKITLEVSSRTRSHSDCAVSESPLASPARTNNGFPKVVLPERNSKSNCKPCEVLQESFADRCRTRQSPAELLDNSVKSSGSSFGNPPTCSKFFGKFRQTATTSA